MSKRRWVLLIVTSLMAVINTAIYRHWNTKWEKEDQATR